MRYRLGSVEYDSEIGAFQGQGRSRKLRARSMHALNYFLQNRDQMVTYDALMEHVWKTVVSDNAVQQILTQIRQAFEAVEPQQELIVTHRGKGFMLNQSLKIEPINGAAPRVKGGQLRATWLLTPALVLGIAALYLMWPVSNTAQAEQHRILLFQSSAGSVLQDPVNPAVQRHLTEVLGLSGRNDVVSLDRTPERGQQDQLAERLWQMNPQLKTVEVHTRAVPEGHEIHLLLIHGDKTRSETRLVDRHLHRVLRQAADWISEHNSDASIETELMRDALPEDDYLVETYLRGLAHAGVGENAQAIEFFELCLQQQPTFNLARLALAKTLRKHARYDESAAQLEAMKSLNLHPRLRAAIDNELASILLMQSRLQDAEAAFREVLQDTPGLYPARLNLATALYRQGRYEEALAELTDLSTSLNPKTHPEYAAIALFTRAGIQLSRQNMPEAKTLLHQSLALFEQLGDRQRQGLVHGRLSYFYMANGQLNAAETHIDKAREIADALNNKRGLLSVLDSQVKLQITRGRFDAASTAIAEMLDLAIELGSLDGQQHAHQWAAQAALERGDLEAAAQHIERHRAMAEVSDSIPTLETHRVLSLQLALAQGDLIGAVHWVELLESMQQKNSIQHSFVPLKVRYLNASGQSEAARAYLQNLRTQPDAANDPGFVQRLDMLLAQQDLPEHPQQALQRLQSIEVNDNIAHPFHSLMAEALLLSGDAISARVAIEKARHAYNQRWSPELQALQNRIETALQ